MIKKLLSKLSTEIENINRILIKYEQNVLIRLAVDIALNLPLFSGSSVKVPLDLTEC